MAEYWARGKKGFWNPDDKFGEEMLMDPLFMGSGVGDMPGCKWEYCDDLVCHPCYSPQISHWMFSQAFLPIKSPPKQRKRVMVVFSAHLEAQA